MIKSYTLLPFIIAMGISYSDLMGEGRLIPENHEYVLRANEIYSTYRAEKELEEAKKEAERLEFLRLEEEKARKIHINFEDLREASGVSIEKLNDYLKGTSLDGLGEYYVGVEAEYGINAVILMGITIEESGWGNSIASKSLNNISGTMENGSLKYFDSLEDCIFYTGRNIAVNYMIEDGVFYNGYSLEDVNKKYCFKDEAGELVVDFNWSSNIRSIVNEFIAYMEG